MEVAAEVWFWIGPKATGTARFGREPLTCLPIFGPFDSQDGCFSGTRRSDECPRLAGKRPKSLTGPPSNLRLLCHLQCVIHFNPEVTNCTLQLGMPKQ